MDIGKDDVGIIATVIGWLVMVFIGGRSYEKLSSRVEVQEKKPDSVSQDTCEERRLGCGREHGIQFDHGEKLFADLKDLIDKNREEAQQQHREIMQSLRQINR